MSNITDANYSSNGVPTPSLGSKNHKKNKTNTNLEESRIADLAQPAISSGQDELGQIKKTIQSEKRQAEGLELARENRNKSLANKIDNILLKGRGEYDFSKMTKLASLLNNMDQLSIIEVIKLIHSISRTELFHFCMPSKIFYLTANQMKEHDESLVFLRIAPKILRGLLANDPGILASDIGRTGRESLDYYIHFMKFMMSDPPDSHEARNILFNIMTVLSENEFLRNNYALDDTLNQGG